MKYCFDLDNTLCLTEGKDYPNCKPFEDRIKIVNKLYDEGHEITIYTARGMGKFKGNTELVYKEYYDLTKNQILNWGIKHHVLLLGKLSYDHFICDKAYNSEDWFKTNIGFIAGAFDIIHPGYIKMFNDCKKYCDYLIVGLHTDPSIENKKLKPVLTTEERTEILLSLKQIDEVIPYNTEKELTDILKTYKSKIKLRFLGDDYSDKLYTGANLNIPITFLNRDHGWSTTKFKTLIHEQFKK